MSLKQANAINQKYTEMSCKLDSIAKVCKLTVTDLTNKNDSLITTNNRLENIVAVTTTKVDDSTYFYYYLDTRARNRVSKFNTWSMQSNLGVTYGNFDRISNELFESSISSRVDLGLRVSKQLSPFFSANLDLYKTKFTGTGDKLLYNTKVKWYAGITPQVQVGNVKFLDSYKNTIFYFYTGVGVISFESDVTTTKDDYTVSKTDLVIPFGVGAKYRLTDKSAINLEFAYKYYLGDDLDGYKQLYSDNDTYNRVSLGYTYTFGKKDKKPLIWHNPFTDAYNKSLLQLK